jgi:NitT/TauT family transport system substrate-binding protein
LKLSVAFGIAVVLVAGLFAAIYKFDSLHKYHRKVDKVVLYLQWFDQSQFAGFYAAQDNGYYDDADLEVEIIPRPRDIKRFYSEGSAQSNLLPRGVASNDQWNVPALVSASENGESKPTAFGVWTADQVLLQYQRDSLHLKVIGTVFDRSLACFMVKEDSKIFSPIDFGGKKVGVYNGYDTEIIYKWLTTAYPSSTLPTEIPLDPSVNGIEMLATDKVNVLPAYAINEPLQAQAQSPPLRVRLIYPEYYNLGYYSDTIIMNKDTWDHDNGKDIAARFLEASERGWRWALEHPDRAVDIVISYDRQHLATQRDIQEKMLDKVSSYVRPSNPMFKMDPGVWNAMTQVLTQQRLLTKNNGCDTLCDYAIVETAHRTLHHWPE